MNDLPDQESSHHAGDDIDNEVRGGPGSELIAGAPRWVKVFVIVALVLSVLLVVGFLAGGGHGPGRHMSP